MEILKAITELGKEMGYEGDQLRNFVKDQQDREREERKEKRDELQREQQVERERQEYELQMAKLKYETDKAAHEADSKVREKEKEIEAEAIKMKMLHIEHSQKLELLEKQQEAGEKMGNMQYSPSPEVSLPKTPKMPPFDDNYDEMDSYLRRFERYAIAVHWKKETWATNLSALLKGRALDVYARMPVESALDYEKLKAALLKRFELTAEGFKKRFRSCRPEDGETHSQFLVRLESYFKRWTEMAEIDHSFDGLLDLMVRDQFLHVCNKELTLFLLERIPKRATEMAILADQFCEARSLPASNFVFRRTESVKSTKPVERSRSIEKRSVFHSDIRNREKHGLSNTKRCYRCGKIGHIASDCRTEFSQRKHVASLQTSDRQRSTSPHKVRFDNQENVSRKSRSRSVTPDKNETKVCGAFVSLTNFPSYSSPGTSTNLSSACDITTSSLSMPTSRGVIGMNTVTVLRDTGCSGVVVRRSCVEEDRITERKQVCVLADGTKVEVPIACIHVDTPYFTGEVEAWCMENPIYDLILGNIPGARSPESPNPDWKLEVNAVQTRQQVQKERQFKYHSMLVPNVVKNQISPDDIEKEQQNDPSLAKIRNLISEGKQNDNKYYFVKENLIFRKFCSPKVENGKHFKQLVVPKAFRHTVMRLAHDSILSGHLATKRTLTKVLSEFYWPGVVADVKRFCQSCDICQRTAPKGRVTRAPLGQMPLIETPFKRVAIDLVGPMEPRSSKGNRYILTLIDYATRYAEAVALPSIETVCVSEALLEIFCRTGVPEEILSDLGSQFTSDLMKEVSRLLSFRQLTTTPYHPIANGLCERINGTIKMMLRRLCAERPKDWDKYLNPLLFAYRDSPQESLGFTPFELIYGRSVRGPMTILKELWTKNIPDSEVKTTYQYVIDLQNRLTETCDLAQKNLAKSSQRYRRLYNRKSRTKNLKAGDKVLVLLPTKNNKLLLQWKGPFNVIEKIGTLDYRIQVHDKTKVFHANMLKLYFDRSDACSSVASLIGVSVIDVQCEDESRIDKDMLVETPSSVSTETFSDCKISPDLKPEEVRQLTDLLQQYSDVLSDKPGYTTLAKHDIKLTTDEPVRAKPYPLPFAMRETIKDEVIKMLEIGVIEPSDSEYCSNVVIVKKPDNTNRFCIDFRPLNMVTVFDCEPIPNMDEIFVKLSNCKYISRLDLTKGYWQLPLTDSAKPKTAFQTPLGLFHFKTMPFGLVCASASFSRLMRKLLFGMSDIDNFIDDIFIYTETFLRHLQVLAELFLRLRQAHLTVKPSKCCFAFRSAQCLGHIVGDNHLEPLPDKLKAVQEAERPVTKKQVRSFLGLVGFYMRFIPNYAMVAAPLTDLTKKGQPNKVVWGDAQERSFQALKKALCSFPVLKLPDLNSQFILQTDSSSVGIGGILLQEENGVKKPVAYASRKLKKAELNYATIEKECLALVWGVLKFQRYLYGREFILETDHRPLVYLKRGKVANARLMRWALLLQPYRFRIVAIKGTDNVGADCLSRL